MRPRGAWRRLRGHAAAKLGRVRRRVGRRGSALLFFALLDFVFAAGLAFAPVEAGGYGFLSTILPLWAWAIPWAGVGVVCAVQAFAARDLLAFACASWLKVGWGCLYLAGWLVGEIARGYVAATIWLAFAGFVQVIAGWSEPPRRGR